MADVCNFCGQETLENGLCNCDSAVAERTATASETIDAAAQNVAQSVEEVVSSVAVAQETVIPQQQVVSNPPPVQPVATYQPPVQPNPQAQPPIQPQQPIQAGYQQPNQAGYQQPNQAGYQQPNQAGYQQPNQAGYQQPNQPGYQQPNQAGYQPPTPGQQQPPAQFQMPSQITEAASAVSSTFMELIKNPLGAAKEGNITTTNSWVLLGIFAVSYLLYLFFKGFRYFGFSSLSGSGNFLFPLLTIAIAVGLLFLALVLSCNFAKVPPVSSQSIFGLIALASIPLTIGYIVNTVLALLFGGMSIGSTLITLVSLFTQILFILIIEHGMSDKIKNNTHRVIAVGISLAIFLGTMALMTGFLDDIMYARSSFGNLWDFFG